MGLIGFGVCVVPQLGALNYPLFWLGGFLFARLDHRTKIGSPSSDLSNLDLPLKNTTFQLLGNMGYMSVKDENSPGRREF